MIQIRSTVWCTDKSSVTLILCIKVLKSHKKRIASIGDVIVACVWKINTKKYENLKSRLQKRFRVGSIHRALLIRTKTNYHRGSSIFIKFNKNHGILITKNVVPLSNRVYGPILREFCMKWPSLGCVTTCII